MRTVRLWIALLAPIASFSVTGPAHAQPGTFPAKPITIVVPYPAGGVGDAMARIIGDKVAKDLGQPVIVDPRPGGNTNIGTLAVSRAPADGYTWLMAAPALTSNPSLYPNLWDPLKDFTGVSIAVSAPNMVTVPAQMKVSTLTEFIDMARKSPGTLNYGNPGIGSSLHLNTELLKLAAGISLTSVAYKGQPPTIPDLIRGDLSVVFLSSGLAAPQIKAGKLKGLAVVARRRLAEFPDIPTLAEAGYPEANVVPWYGFVISSHTPDDIAARIHKAIADAMRSPEVQQKLRASGLEPEPARTMAEIRSVLHSDFLKYREVVQKANIHPE